MPKALPAIARDAVNGFEVRHPLFVAAVVAAFAVALADIGVEWGWSAVAGCAALGWILRRWRVGLVWGLCAGIAVGVFSSRDLGRQRAEQGLVRGTAELASGEVLEDARQGEFWMVMVRLDSGPYAGNKVWWKGRGESPVVGSKVAARGSFQPLPKPRNPGEFDQAAWLRRNGVACVFEASHTAGDVETGDWPRRGAALRQGFRTAVTVGLDEESQAARVIRAVVIGEQPQDADMLIAAFRNSGTLHAFSVSGLHVAMVGSIGWGFLSLLGVPRRWAILCLLPLVFGYAWITGNSPPAVRSSLMAAVFLGAFLVRRRPDLLNALGAVLLAAMLWDGRLLFQPGVQLSYGVVAVIAIGTSWAARIFDWMATPELYLPTVKMSRWQRLWLGFRRKLAGSLAVSTAAGVGSAPLTAYHFGLITPISILAGIVLIPLVFLVLGGSLISAALYPVVHPASRVLNHVNAFFADACVTTASAFAKVPGGNFQIRKNKQPEILVFDLEFGAGASCFDGGGSGAVMFDCGDPYTFRRTVVPSLRALGMSPDSVVISHPDGGHLGGGPPVWEAFPVRQVLLPVERSRSRTYRSWLQEAPAAGIRVLQARDHASLPLPDQAMLEILHAPDPYAVNAIADERVAVFRLHWRGWKILLTGDAGIATELAILDAKKDVRADLIIAGRHRSDISLCDRFLNAVDPLAIVASNAAFPVEERINPRRAAYWESRNIRLIDQARTGGVTITIDPEGALRLEGFVDKSTLVLPPRVR